MSEDVYEKLAKKLDAHPSGFPRTKKGIELKILKKIFTPEEAALANDMQWVPETTTQIVERTGRDPVKTGEMLQNMLRKGQIHGFPMEEDFAFIGLPFIVGIYFFNAPYIDEELAKLFEEYYKSWAQGTLNNTPTFHRVISIDKSIPLDFEVFPYEKVSSILKDAKSFGLFPCMCKLQKQKIDDSCNHPTNTCLVFSQAEHAFDNISVIESLTEEEAYKALKDFEDAGLVHTMGNFREPNPGMEFICSCCSCGCTFLRGVAELGIENSIAKSNFYAVVDKDACTGCKTCIDRCQFKAINFENDKSYVDKSHCAGCGLCVTTCDSNAIKLMKKSKDETEHTPQNIQEWIAERAKNR
jgi:NAD-dependent dihydropyrimidine dehydrogenase PreA subunit